MITRVPPKTKANNQINRFRVKPIKCVLIKEGNSNHRNQYRSQLYQTEFVLFELHSAKYALLCAIFCSDIQSM